MQVSGNDVAAVGMTGQMHGLTLPTAAARFCAPRSSGTISGPAQCDEIHARSAGALHPDHGQQSTDRLHGTQDPLGPGRTSPRSMPGLHRSCCQRTTSATGSRRIRHGQGRASGTVLFDLEGARLVARGARGPGDPRVPVATDVRRPRGHERDQQGRRGGDRLRAHTCRRGWRRSGGGGGGRRRRRTGHRQPGAGHFGRRLCLDRWTLYRARGTSARLATPCRARGT